MAKINDGGPMYPSDDEWWDSSANAVRHGRHHGASVRTVAAIAAMQGMVQGCVGKLNGTFTPYATGPCNSVIAERAVVLADSLIRELNKEGDE